MNKKKSASKAPKAVESAPIQETFTEEIAVKEPVTKAPVKEIPLPEPISSWAMKDRLYALKDGLSPLTYTIKSSNILLIRLSFRIRIPIAIAIICTTALSLAMIIISLRLLQYFFVSNIRNFGLAMLMNHLICCRSIITIIMLFN